MAKKAVNSDSVPDDEDGPKWKEELHVAFEYLSNVFMIRRHDLHSHKSKKSKKDAKKKREDCLQEKYKEKMEEFKMKRKFDAEKNKKPANKISKIDVKNGKGKQNNRPKQNKRPKGPVLAENENVKNVEDVLDISEVTGKKSLKLHLVDIEKHEKKVKRAREIEGAEAAIGIHSGKQLELAKAKVEGFKTKDDPEMLKKSMKRNEFRKKKSKSIWSQRVQTVQNQKAERQQKRKANLKQRVDEKKQKRVALLKKKGRYFSGL